MYCLLLGVLGYWHCTVYTAPGWVEDGGYTLLLTLEYVSFWCWFALCTGTGGTATGSFSECVLPPAPAHDVSVRRPIEHQLAELSFVCFRNSPQFVIVKYSIFLRGNLIYSSSYFVVEDLFKWLDIVYTSWSLPWLGCNGFLLSAAS